MSNIFKQYVMKEVNEFFLNVKNVIPFRNYAQGGHFIVKLNTMCAQSLLPLYYMP